VHCQKNAPPPPKKRIEIVGRKWLSKPEPHTGCSALEEEEEEEEEEDYDDVMLVAGKDIWDRVEDSNRRKEEIA